MASATAVDVVLAEPRRYRLDRVSGLGEFHAPTLLRAEEEPCPAAPTRRDGTGLRAAAGRGRGPLKPPCAPSPHAPG